MKRIFAWILLLPAVFVVGFFVYVAVANDPGCGSLEPGLCFGAGLLTMVVAPLACITTPVSIFLFIRSRKDR